MRRILDNRTLYVTLFVLFAFTKAASTLRRLYADAARFTDLARLLRLLIDTAPSADDRSQLRLELAHLQRDRFSAPADAADTLRELLDENPDHSDAVVTLSQLLEQTGRDEDLAELLNREIDRAADRNDAPSELSLRVRLGEVFESRLKDTPRALAVFEEVLDREPGHRGALEAVARLAETRGQWERAAGALQQLMASAANGTSVGFALRLAAAREYLGDGEGTEEALRRALELDPSNGQVRERLRAHYEHHENWASLAALLVQEADLVHAAYPFEKGGGAIDPSPRHDDDREGAPPSSDVSRATDGATRPSSVPPGVALVQPPLTGPVADQVRLLRAAAEIHIAKNQSWADAVPLLERASALVPQDRELLLMLCDAYTAASRERDAATVLERVIASFGTRRTKELSLYHHRLGRALAQLGDKEVALLQFDMAFKIDPGSVSVLRDLGVLALETNDLDRAQKTFRALLLQRLEPDTGISKGEVFYYLGEISAKQGDKVKAVQMLERAIESEPGLDRAKAMLNELKG